MAVMGAVAFSFSQSTWEEKAIASIPTYSETHQEAVQASNQATSSQINAWLAELGNPIALESVSSEDVLIRLAQTLDEYLLNEYPSERETRSDIDEYTSRVSVIILTADPSNRFEGALGVVVRDQGNTYRILTRKHVIDECGRDQETAYCSIVEVSRDGTISRIDPSNTANSAAVLEEDNSSDLLMVGLRSSSFTRQSAEIQRINRGSEVLTVAVAGYDASNSVVQSLNSQIVDEAWYQEQAAGCVDPSSRPTSDDLIYLRIQEDSRFRNGFSGGPLTLSSGEIVGLHGGTGPETDIHPCSHIGFGVGYDRISSNRKLLALIRGFSNLLHQRRIEFMETR